ncbi:hypothetical protein [Brasilonema sp. UFV-L1]|uniref:hypothetical protein n=1 Tax=Brasilonema sp. UFV-L1 TaxID=2234130 RepID=UPI00145C79FF|nr:hypothetical protein [Brasilonema sp. UFV-L1]NMG09746.1 hypothetical protein [Brasilonema sp. UFV-L1]
MNRSYRANRKNQKNKKSKNKPNASKQTKQLTTQKASSTVRPEINLEELIEQVEQEQIQQEKEIKELRRILAFAKPASEIEFLMISLLKMSADVDDCSCEREVFIGDNYERARQIGIRLDQIGGWDLMSRVAHMLPRIDWNEIDRTWHGIGTWLR